MESKYVEPSSFSPPLPSTRWWSKDTVAIVTGANKGIGFALVKRLAESGLTVILTARDEARGLKAVQSLTAQRLHVHFSLLDVSDPDSIKTFASWFQHTFRKLDILVNNAGVSFNNIDENSVEHAEIVIKTNYHGPKMLIEALLPMFRHSSSVSRILNISSRLGSLNIDSPFPLPINLILMMIFHAHMQKKLKNPNMKEILLDEEKLSKDWIDHIVSTFLENVKTGTWKNQGWPEIWTDYAVSKLALNAYSRVLAKRYEGCGLSVNCFCPGFTQTAMTGGKGNHTADAAAIIGARLILLPPEELPTGKFYLGFSPQVYSKL